MTTTTLKDRYALRHPSVSGAFATARDAVHLWSQRARQRRHLSEISAEMLRDIGVSPRVARAEAGKPFWVS